MFINTNACIILKRVLGLGGEAIDNGFIKFKCKMVKDYGN